VSVGSQRILSYKDEEYVRQLSHATLTDTVTIEPWWGEWEGDTTQAFVANNDPSTAPIFTSTNPAPFQQAESFSDVPCRAIPTTGSTYRAANGQSYSLSGLEVHIPAGIQNLYNHQRTIVSGSQTQFYGHFVFWQGKVFSIERAETWGTLKIVTILHCLEIPMQYNIPPKESAAYILAEDFAFILDETYRPLRME
jgi:hypothetical protein